MFCGASSVSGSLYCFVIIYIASASSFIAGSTVALNEERLITCVADLARDVSSAYGSTSNATARDEKVADVVSDFVSSCLQLRVQPARALRIMVPFRGDQPFLTEYAAKFENATGVKVVLNAVNFFEIGVEARQELLSNLTDFSDGWVLDPGTTGELAALQGFKSLDEYIPEDPSIRWLDFSRFYRQASAIYDSKVISVPLDGDLLLMYYRRDLFRRYNLSVPVTWEDFVDLAVRMNGTKTDGNGTRDLYGICFDNGPPVCKANFLLIAMAAPYLQYRGTQQGVFFDPDTMRPLADTEAMARAVHHYLRLFAVQSREASCSGSNSLFSSGQCLMTINWGDEFKANAQTNGSSSWASRGWELGVARLPGAAEVLDRATGRLVPCTSQDTCPYARRVELANGASALVNFAPYSAFGGWAGAVSRIAPPEYQRRAYQFFAYVAQPENSWRDVLDPNTGIDPYRLSQLEVDGPNFARWTDAGYDSAATRAYLSAIREALESENMVLDSRMEYVEAPYRLMIEAGLHSLTWNAAPNVTPSGMLRNLQEKMAAGLVASGSLDSLQRQYCRIIGCKVAAALAPAAPPVPEDLRVQVSKGVIGAAIATSLVVVMLAAVLGLVMWRRASQHRHLLARGVKAPGPGPATTLLVTDIESSTTLWELLPEAAMGKAVEVHHSVVRAALARFSGYESATEGDSFICAFHTAADAVHCAVHIQQALVFAPWPPELLACSGLPAAAAEVLTPGPRCSDVMAMLLGDTRVFLNITRPQQQQQHKRLALPVGRPSSSGNAAAAGAPAPVQRWPSAVHPPVPSRAVLGGLPSSAAAAQSAYTMLAAGDSTPPDEAISGNVPTVDPQDKCDDSGALGNIQIVMSGEMEAQPRSYGCDGGEAQSNSLAASPLKPLRIAELRSPPFRRCSEGASPLPAAGRRHTTGQLQFGIGGSQTDTAAGAFRLQEADADPARLCLIDCIKMAWPGAGSGGLLPAAASLLVGPYRQGSPSVSINSLGGDASWHNPSGHASLGAPQRQASQTPSSQATSVSVMLRKFVMQRNHEPRLPCPDGKALFGSGSGRATATGGSGGVRASVVLFRGLRVRMGLATGVPCATDVSYVAGEARMHYSGAGMRLARAVQSAAAGGQVLLSDSTFAALREEPGKLSGPSAALLGLHMGLHELVEGGDLAPQQVYQAVPQRLGGRLALLPPLKVRSTFATGVLSAPVGCAAVAFVYAVGADSLLAWDAAVARQALEMLEKAFEREVMRVNEAGGGGYIVEATGGLLLAVFADPALAVSCCLAAVAAMPTVSWPEALMENALCEELTVAGVDAEGRLAQTVLFRGLRIKAGLDYGSVRATINSGTGRLTYRGRVMNRAARIASRATSGQVLCSRDLWHPVSKTSGPPPQIAAMSMGTTSLKGVPEPVELFVCQQALAPQSPREMKGGLLSLRGSLRGMLTVGLVGSTGGPTGSHVP